MGYDVYFNGHIEFPNEAAMAQALAALNNADEFFADRPVDTMTDALVEALPVTAQIGTGETDHTPLVFVFSGETHDEEPIDRLLAAVAAEGSGVDYTGEDDAFWQSLVVDGQLVSRDGVRTYMDPRTQQTDEYAHGVEAALAATETVLHSRAGDSAESLMNTIRAYLVDHRSCRCHP